MELIKPTNANFWLFAYDINLFRVTDALPGEVIDFTINGYVERRTADADGNAECNVSSYLQAMFTDTKGNDEFATTKEATINVRSAAGITITGNYIVVYGASAPGEHVYTARTTEDVHYWPNFQAQDGSPVQKLYALRAYNSTFFATKNGEQIDDSVITPDTKGVIAYPLSLLGDGDCVVESYVRPGSPYRITKLRNIIRHDDTNGLFLRWVDRHGCFQYWLFTIGAEERGSAAYGSEFPIIYEEDGNQYTAVRTQGRTATRSQEVCAALVGYDEYKMLSGLLSSPNVCAYMPDERVWQPVQVAAGKATWSRDKHEKMQDFTASVIYPDFNVQTL